MFCSDPIQNGHSLVGMAVYFLWTKKVIFNRKLRAFRMYSGQKEPGEYILDLIQDSKTFFRIEICWILTELRPCFRNCVSVAPALAVTHKEKRRFEKKVLYFRQKWRYFNSENGFGIFRKIQYIVPGLIFSKKNSFWPPYWFNHHFLLKIAHSGATGPSISGIF